MKTFDLYHLYLLSVRTAYLTNKNMAWNYIKQSLTDNDVLRETNEVKNTIADQSILAATDTLVFSSNLSSLCV